MGSSSKPKKDKKKDKKKARQSVDDDASSASPTASTTTTQDNNTHNKRSSSSSSSSRIKIRMRLAESVLSADDRSQHKANPLVVPPVLASFPHGPPRDPHALDFHCRASDSKRRRLRLQAETARVRYTADQPAVARKATAKYMVGIYSKEKQEVVLYPVETIMSLGQRVRKRAAAAGSDDDDEDLEAMEGVSDDDEEEEGNEKDVSLTYAERRKSLVDTFGTKKKKRVMQSQEENRIRAEGVVGLSALGGFLADSVKEVHKEAVETGKKLTPAEASRATLLPPFNAQAHNVDQVYLLKQMLGGGEIWDSLAQELEELLDSVDTGSDGGPEAVREVILSKFQHWPHFVKHRIREAPMPVPRNQQEQQQQQQQGRFSSASSSSSSSLLDARRVHMCRLLLLRHLFELHRLPPTIRGGASKLSSMLGLGNVNETVALVFLEHFFTPDVGSSGDDEKNMRYIRNKPLIDKLLLHLLVLSLVVGGFRVSATKIAQDLKMTPGDCVDLLKETGATVKKVYGGGGGGDEEEGGTGKKKGKEEWIAELTLPLKFPEVKRIMRAKKG